MPFPFVSPMPTASKPRFSFGVVLVIVRRRFPVAPEKICTLPAAAAPSLLV